MKIKQFLLDLFMLNIFSSCKNKKNNVHIDTIPIYTSNEIYSELFTESKILYEYSNTMNSLYTDKESSIKMAERLDKLGFTNTQTHSEVKAEIKRLDLLNKENEIKKILFEAINYFSSKYPNYTFITEDIVLNICKKYNLVCNKVNEYIGLVPIDQIESMEKFKIDEDDSCYMHTCKDIRYNCIINYVYGKYNDVIYDNRIGYRTIKDKCPLQIIAPIENFHNSDTNYNIEKSENYLTTKDPIVLKPVIFKGTKYYLIVTSWDN